MVDRFLLCVLGWVSWEIIINQGRAGQGREKIDGMIGFMVLLFTPLLRRYLFMESRISLNLFIFLCERYLNFGSELMFV